MTTPLAGSPVPAVLPTGHVVTRDEVALFRRDRGQGPPVVFLASWSLPGDSWNAQVIPLVAAGLRCLAYDRRSHGRSADPGRGMDYDTLADDLEDVLAAHGLAGVTLVAMSGAAGEAVRYLTRHGAGRIAGLVLVGPTTPLLARTPEHPDGLDPALLAALRDQLRQDFPRWLAENARSFGGSEASEATLDWIRSLSLQAALPALLEFHQTLSSTDFHAELEGISVPTLVIQGDADQTCPLDLTGRRTARLIPGARLRVYEGAPHGLIVSHPARLAEDILRFVRPG